MIVVFHFLYCATQYYINLLKSVCISENVTQNLQDMCKPKTSVDAEEKLIFDPPVYKQRYGEIQSILLDNKWRDNIQKIVDFGCAELKLFHFINRLHRIKEIFAVDIDEELLKEHLFRIQPLLTDFINRRMTPLNISVFQGSISDPDDRLCDTDAVIGIEIIEHLYPDTLEALPYNIFGIIKPKLVVFTTPNADFNVLFPNFKGIRHYDHKFEWSREQFEMWSENIVTRFPNYSVSFRGIGQGPPGTEYLGCCSQMAIFIQNQSDYEYINESSFGVCTYHSETIKFSPEENTNQYYKLLERVEYPYDQDERTVQQKIYDELQYRMNVMGSINGRFYNYDRSRIEIPIIELIYNQYTHFTTVSEACSILTEAGHQIEKCLVCDTLETCVVYEPDMDSSNSVGSSTSNEDHESDWELDYEDQKKSWAGSAEPENEQLEPFPHVKDVIYTLLNNLTRHNDEDLVENGTTSSIAENQSNVFECNNQMCDSGYGVSTSNLTSSAHSNSDVSFDVLNGYNSPSKPSHANTPTDHFVFQECVPLQNSSDGSQTMPQSISGSVHRSDVSSKIITNSAGMAKEMEKVNHELEFNGEVNEIPLNGDLHNMVQPQYDEVENGDLANNNRDLEGNNYPNAVENERNNENDNENVVLQHIEDIGDIRNDDDENRNDVDDYHIVAEVDVLPAQNDHHVLDLRFSSREALFDPSSQVDLLEDYDVAAEGESINVGNNERIHYVDLDVDPDDDDDYYEPDPVLPMNADPFPNWLLNLLGPRLPDEIEAHDEPHFYCQGDGLGVHPSFVEEEDSENDNSSTDSSDTLTSEFGSNDEAEAEPSLSEVDAGSLPEDISEAPEQEPTLRIINFSPHISTAIDTKPVEPVVSTAGCSSGTESADEFFDSNEETVSINTQKPITENNTENKK